MINYFLYNQMYALCILAALSLRQHVQQNWQQNQTKRIPSQPSFNFLKCIDPENSPRTEKFRRDYPNFEESGYREPDESKSPDFLFSCFQKLTEGAQMIIENIGESINNSKVINNPWSKNFFETAILLSNKPEDEFWA